MLIGIPFGVRFSHPDEVRRGVIRLRCTGGKESQQQQTTPVSALIDRTTYLFAMMFGIVDTTKISMPRLWITLMSTQFPTGMRDRPQRRVEQTTDSGSRSRTTGTDYSLWIGI